MEPNVGVDQNELWGRNKWRKKSLPIDGLQHDTGGSHFRVAPGK